MGGPCRRRGGPSTGRARPRYRRRGRRVDRAPACRRCPCPRCRAASGSRATAADTVRWPGRPRAAGRCGLAAVAEPTVSSCGESSVLRVRCPAPDVAGSALAAHRRRHRAAACRRTSTCRRQGAGGPAGVARLRRTARNVVASQGFPSAAARGLVGSRRPPPLKTPSLASGPDWGPEMGPFPGPLRSGGSTRGEGVRGEREYAGEGVRGDREYAGIGNEEGAGLRGVG
jgi:hypothetical protein